MIDGRSRTLILLVGVYGQADDYGDYHYSNGDKSILLFHVILQNHAAQLSIEARPVITNVPYAIIFRMSALDDIRNERLKKIERLIAAGMPPYPSDSKRDRSVAEVLGDFDKLSSSESETTIAGRIRAKREHGGSTFVDLFDGSGTMQTLLKLDSLDKKTYQLFLDCVDEGDFVEVCGKAFITKRGEKTIEAKSWRMLAKSLRPVPSKWYGLKDEDERYRRRELDILLTPDLAEMIRRRAKFWQVIRKYLTDRGFVEVETPVLETKTGGAEARPFGTHHNALDIDVYLRISAGELWQKKLLVAGLPKVFEIGRIFRNEGMSFEHLQDYTQLEFYMAYADYKVGMKMIAELYRTVAKEVFGTTSFTIREHEIDLSDEWQCFDFCNLFNEHYGLDALSATLKDVRAVLEENKITFDKKTLTLERGVDLLWKQIRKQIGGPGFLINVPAYLEPLAKRSATEPRAVERFQVLLAGSEVGKGFSELNDPIDQKERFIHQQALRDKGDQEAQMADFDFVEALEYGMPPSFGFGVSERLFSFLQGVSAREGQIFPLLRPKKD